MASLATLDPRLRPGAEWFVNWLREQGVTVQITSARRSSGEQARLYARYVHGQSKYPAAPPGTSTHEFGLAFDMVVPANLTQAVGEAWEQFGGRWGGRFHDPVHFEFPGATKAASKKKPRPTKQVKAAQKYSSKARPKDEPLQDMGLGPLSFGKWWTTFVPGIGKVEDWLVSVLGS